MKIKPLANFIHIIKPQPERKTDTGIYLPKEESISKYQGRVLSIGPDVKCVKVGDTIIYKQYSSHLVPNATDEYLVAESDVIATKTAM